MDNWSNPIVADIELPQVEVSHKPVLLNLCKMIVGQVEDLQSSEVVRTLQVVAGQLVVREVKCLQVVGGHQKVGVQLLQVVETQVKALKGQQIMKE